MSFGLDKYLKKKKKGKKEQVEEEPVEEEQVERTLEDHLDTKHDWRSILEETVRAMILFPHYLDYSRMNILPQAYQLGKYLSYRTRKL